MSRVTTMQRLYFATVGFLAWTVGYWCYFHPDLSANGIPWTLPPLCATFLGSMYLSGGVYTIICIFSRRWREVQMFMPQCALWTGGLTIVSLFYIPAFDFSRNQTQLWWLAYIAFPIIAAGFLWVHRSELNPKPQDDAPFPKWVRVYLRIQGSVMIGLALALLFAPQLMQPLWAWRTGDMMLQMYSMPLLAYGVGSWLMMRLLTWSQVRSALIAHTIFTGAEFFACLRFFALLDGPSVSVALWLGGLAVMTGALIVGLASSRTSKLVQVASRTFAAS